MGPISLFVLPFPQTVTDTLNTSAISDTSLSDLCFLSTLKPGNLQIRLQFISYPSMYLWEREQYESGSTEKVTLIMSFYCPLSLNVQFSSITVTSSLATKQLCGAQLGGLVGLHVHVSCLLLNRICDEWLPAAFSSTVSISFFYSASIFCTTCTEVVIFVTSFSQIWLKLASVPVNYLGNWQTDEQKDNLII